MGGGLMQLVAYGAQDVYLTGNPVDTFWKVSYKRHTNFAMESIEQTFNGQADFGRRVTCTISRNGDLAYRTYLQVTLPEINQLMANTTANTTANTGVYARWLDYIGEQLISQVEVEIGGQRIDRQYGDSMHIRNQLTMTAEQQKGYFKMIGNTTKLTYITEPATKPATEATTKPATDVPTDVPTNDNYGPKESLPETTLYVPLQFWFNRHSGLALPLIALQFHEVKINLDIRPIGECLWAVDNLNTTATTAYQQSLVSASLYVDYIFLDTDERRRMTQNPHEYLIEQLQFTGDESVGSSSNKIKLNFNHPVKELIWVVQPDANVDYCSSLDDTKSQLFKVHGAQPFNYTDAIDILPNSTSAFGSTQIPTSIDNKQSKKFDAKTFVLAETALDMHCWGENPVVTAKLQLNGHDRFSEREGSYFDQVQPFQHHTRHPDTGINVYSFALRPEIHQPSGTCNFSRIDNATLQLVLSNSTVQGTATAKVRVYAVNYNILRVMSGMAGLAYSN